MKAWALVLAGGEGGVLSIPGSLRPGSPCWKDSKAWQSSQTLQALPLSGHLCSQSHLQEMG